MTGFINALLDLSLKGSLVIGIVLVLRLALKKAPKIFPTAFGPLPLSV